jgi:hypothetical protein
MLFSDLHRIKLGREDDWFDPILDHDTKLFIDPFLIFRRGKGPFADAHATLIGFFRAAFELAAATGGRTASVQHKKLLSMLLFPEVDGLRLGYAKEGHGGAGTAAGFAKAFAEAIMTSIALGLQNFKHFEEIGIFNEGIGRDRVSDITANVLINRLIEYTQAVCQRHGVKTQPRQLRGGYDLGTMMWHDDDFDLPVNPFTGDAVILVPRGFLRTDPTLAKDGFKDYLWETKNEELRTDLNFAIKSDIDQKAVVAIAREHRDWVADSIASAEDEATPSPYDLAHDPEGLYRWHQVTRDFVSSNPHSFTVSSGAELADFVATLADKFRLFVEKKGGWRLMWDRGNEMSEEGVQNYFYGLAYHYCEANNVVMQREVETGRGPVDFYFSSGFRSRVLMEAKLAKNGKFWNNLRRQLPEYMTAEGIQRGHYLVVCYRDDDVKKKVPDIRSTLSDVEQQTGYQIRASAIDARPGKPSASKLR